MAKKVLIVDDSALIRKQLGTILDKDGYDIGYAKNGLEAVEFTGEVDFDVITMDINMPVMDGLSAVKIIMAKNPTPIIMVSSLTQEQADITFEALELGAIDYVPKPGTITLHIEETKDEILEKVRVASNINKSRLSLRKEATRKRNSLSNQAKLNKAVISNKVPTKLVLVGASTGGPGLIEDIVTSLPANYPYPVCIVQHMPETFTGGFARRLDKNSQIHVVESKNGEAVVAGKAIIGKGGWHMHFMKKASGALSIKQVPNSMKRFFIPSVDEMFFSISKTYDAKNILAVELTGIGDDGADGMVELRAKGAYTIAEDESTAVVYGMPKEAWVRGGAMKKMPFPEVLKEILKFGES
jgi:two-component system chemotaxis response regulator CheB